MYVYTVPASSSVDLDRGNDREETMENPRSNTFPMVKVLVRYWSGISQVLVRYSASVQSQV